MARFCPECGAQFAPNAKFCVSCGASAPVGLGDAPPPASPPPAGGGDPDATQPFRPDDLAGPAPEAPLVGAPPVGAPPEPGVDAAPRDPAKTPPLGMAALPDPAPGQGGSLADQFSAWPDEAEGPAVGSTPVPPPPAGPPPAGPSYRSEPPYGAPAPQGPPAYGPPPPVPGQPVPVGYGPPAGGAPDAYYGYDDGTPAYEPVYVDEAPRRRAWWPFAVVGAGIVVVALIWLLLSQRGGPATPAASSSSSAPKTTSAPPTTTVTTTTSKPDPAKVKTANEAIVSILEAGRGSIATLQSGINTYCGGDKVKGRDQIRQALQGRSAQLNKLNQVGDGPFKDLQGGPEAREKLKAALQAAVDADQLYLTLAEGNQQVCPGGADLAAANTKATTAKDAFVATWNPIAASAGIKPLRREDI